MIFLSLDFETTGPDTEKDRIIEHGSVLYSSGLKKILEIQGMMVKDNVPISPFITKLTGVHPVAVEKYGYETEDMLDIVLDMASNADYYLGYNIRRFDIKMFKNWAKRYSKEIPDLPVVDVFADLPWKVPVSTLTHTLADHGKINPFPHSAFSDALGSILLLQSYDENEILRRSTSPAVVLRAHQARGENDIVKAAPFRFRWNPDNKIWWKPAKEQDVAEIMAEAPFKITIEKGFTIEELES